MSPRKPDENEEPHREENLVISPLATKPLDVWVMPSLDQPAVIRPIMHDGIQQRPDQLACPEEPLASPQNYKLNKMVDILGW